MTRPLLDYRPGEVLRVLSLGAGVQSSTLAKKAAMGLIGPMPHCAIFSDTKSEPAAVMAWLDWLETQLPFPIYRVSAGSLRENLLTDAEGRFVSVPFFTDSGGKMGMTRRQCTREFKIQPIERRIRELLGLQPGERAPRGSILVEQWIGISWDERQRMKESHKAYIQHRWPLIELEWTRGHCLDWWLSMGLPTPPKSACTFCPYHDDAMWVDMRDNDPESFADAVAVDRSVRRAGARIAQGMDANLYVHRSLKPLDEVEFNVNDTQGHLFGMANECEGMCGV